MHNACRFAGYFPCGHTLNQALRVTGEEWHVSGGGGWSSDQSLCWGWPRPAPKGSGWTRNCCSVTPSRRTHEGGLTPVATLTVAWPAADWGCAFLSWSWPQNRSRSAGIKQRRDLDQDVVKHKIYNKTNQKSLASQLHTAAASWIWETEQHIRLCTAVAFDIILIPFKRHRNKTKTCDSTHKIPTFLLFWRDEGAKSDSRRHVFHHVMRVATAHWSFL